MSQSRVIFSNFGVPRGAILQKADGVVGRAWEPEFKGKDNEFGDAAKEWLQSWFNVCDVQGNLQDFKTSLKMDSVAVDRDGDVFILLTETKTGYPQIQHIPAHRVGTRSASVKDDILLVGSYRGNRIKNGVVENKSWITSRLLCARQRSQRRQIYFSTRHGSHCRPTMAQPEPGNPSIVTRHS